MANTLRFKRGLVSGIPTAALGEPLFTTDTFDLYIGNGTTNTRFQKYIASGTTSQLLRGDGSLLTMPIVLTSPSNGQVLKYNGTSWVNDSDAGITGSGSAGQVAYFTGATTQGGSNNLFWDSTNNRLGIGLNNPATALEVSTSGLNTVFVTNPTTTGTTTGSGIGFKAYNGSSVTQYGGIFLTSNTWSFGTYAAQQLSIGSDGTGGLALRSANSAPIRFFTGGATAGVSTLRATLDASGNLGLGVTPSNALAGARTFEIGANGVIYSETASSSFNSLNMGVNWYFNASASLLYKNTGVAASTYIQYQGSHIWRYAASGTANNPITWTTPMTLTANGRLLLGTTTEGTQLLQVNGDTLMKGSGNTSATTALTVQNSASTNIFRTQNDGLIQFGANGNVAILTNNDGTNTPNLSGVGIRLNHAISNQAQVGFTFKSYFDSMTATSGIQTNASFNQGFRPTSGTAQFNQVHVNFTIDQTGGANGITRGLYVQPNLLSAADWRSIETSNNSGWAFYGAGSANSYFGGSVGIGTTSLTGYSLVVGKNITGSTNAQAVRSVGVIQSDVTSKAYYYTAQSFTANANFALPDLYLYAAFGGTLSNITAGGSITNQYGYFADASLTGATNNYGFYGNIASGTGRWNLYMNGTAANYLNGNLGVGALPNTYTGINLAKPLTGLSLAFGVVSSGTIQSDVTNSAYYFITGAKTQAASFTLPALYHYEASQGTFGAGSSVTSQFAFFASASIIGATNNFGFYGNIAAATGRWNLYMNGTAANYMAGSLGIGTTNLTGVSLRVNKALTGSATVVGIYHTGQVQSDVTSTAYANYNVLSTAAASFTLPNYFHYGAEQGTIGAGSAVTNQYGFYAFATMVGATNNYGFYGNIASGTGRWNFYANGTASNYFNGNVLLGSTTDSGEKLQVNGTMKVTGASTFNDTITLTKGSAATIIVNTTDTTSTSAFRWWENGVSKALAQYINSAFATTARQNRLEIGGNLLGGLALVSNGDFTNPPFLLANSGAATFSSSVTAASYNATTQNIFSVGGTEGMRLTSSNRNLHIGTFVSDSGEKLQVVGTAKIGTYSTTGYSLVVQNNGANDVSGIRISTGATVDGYLSLAYDATNTYGSIQAGDNNVFRNIVLNRQGGSVGVGANPNNSAVLQADSTTRGFLPPRMTTTQKNAIPTPAAGLIVYDTTDNKHYGYDGTNWNAFY